MSKSPGVFAWLSVVKRDCSFSSDSILSLVRLMVALMRCCSRSWRVLSESKSLSCFFSAISSKINGLPDAAAFIAPALAASPSISSMTRVLISPFTHLLDKLGFVFDDLPLHRVHGLLGGIPMNFNFKVFRVFGV